MDEALYETIYKTLLAEIQAGTYADGKRLPTEAQLSQRFFVSHITSKQALNKLAQQGLVVRIPGRGTYLRKDAALPPSSPLHSRHMPLIALVMGGYSASFGLDVINGAVQKAQDLHMNLIVRITNNRQQQEADTLRSLMAAGLEGIILQPARRAVQRGHPGGAAPEMPDRHARPRAARPGHPLRGGGQPRAGQNGGAAPD